LSNVWQTTLRLPELSQASGILKRVQGLIDLIDHLRQVAESRRAAVLGLQGRVLELAAQVQTDSFSTGEAQTKAMRNLLVPNRPPIWRRENLNRSQEDASLLWETSLSLFRNYVRTHPAIFVLHAIIILVLAAIVRWLRRGLHKWTAEEPGLRRTAPVFDVPLSTATALYSVWSFSRRPFWPAS
jgi:hypothetical protein